MSGATSNTDRACILRFEKVDVVLAMSLAGLVNMSMMLMAVSGSVVGAALAATPVGL